MYSSFILNYIFGGVHITNFKHINASDLGEGWKEEQFISSDNPVVFIKDMVMTNDEKLLDSNKMNKDKIRLEKMSSKLSEFGANGMHIIQFCKRQETFHRYIEIDTLFFKDTGGAKGYFSDLIKSNGAIKIIGLGDEAAIITRKYTNKMIYFIQKSNVFISIS